jgi:hypothetical protein
MTRPIRPLIVDWHRGVSSVTGNEVDYDPKYADEHAAGTPVGKFHGMKNRAGAYGLREMTTNELAQVHKWIRGVYNKNPSVILSYVASGGNLGTITDTRLQAGAYLTRVERFPTEGETAEPSTVSVNYSRIEQTKATGLTLDYNFPRPLRMNYYSFSKPVIQHMSMTDVINTLIAPALNPGNPGILGWAGQYIFWNNTAIPYVGATNTDGGNYTDVGTIFNDTRANTAAYTAGGIPETLDQPFTAVEYKLLRANANHMELPHNMIYHDTPNSVQRYNWPGLESWIQSVARWWAVNTLNYSIDGTGNFAHGVALTDTKLNGAGNYQTLYVNTDDYRAQEFPDGTSVTQNTYELKNGV